MVSGKTVTISRIVTKFSVTKSRIHCITNQISCKCLQAYKNYTFKSLKFFPQNCQGSHFSLFFWPTIYVQWILDLVTLNLVTILDLVTLLPLTRFLCSKMHRFSDNLANFIVLI